MLTSLILKLFVPGMGPDPSPRVRIRCGIVSGITGICCNLLLVAVKITLAVFSGSIAIAADALNNLSDAGAGIITAAGFRLSGRAADAEHPFGHGRTEYVAGLVVSLLIVGLGVSFLKDSVVSLFRSREIHADRITIVIFSATILCKCWMFFFYRRIGRLLRSDVVLAAAYDSLSDCLGTLVVVAALIAARYTSFPVDGCAGIIVASMILWAGGNVLKDTVSKLLGEPPAGELVTKLRETLLGCPGIDGVHDIIIHNYGENTYYVTAHAEISCEGDRFSAHDILENAEVQVAKALPVHLLLHGDPYDKADPAVIWWRSRLENAVALLDSELKLYDFRLENVPDHPAPVLSCHLLIPHKYGMSENEVTSILQEKMRSFDASVTVSIRFLNSFI